MRERGEMRFTYKAYKYKSEATQNIYLVLFCAYRCLELTLWYDNIDVHFLCNAVTQCVRARTLGTNLHISQLGDTYASVN